MRNGDILACHSRATKRLAHGHFVEFHPTQQSKIVKSNMLLGLFAEPRAIRRV